VRNSHQKGSRKFVSDITFHKVVDQVLTEPKTISMVHEDTILGSNRFLPPDLPHGPLNAFLTEGLEKATKINRALCAHSSAGQSDGIRTRKEGIFAKH